MKDIDYYRRNDIGQYYTESGNFLFSAQKKVLRSIKATKIDFNKGDKVFFSNHISYPRFKFRDWGLSKGVSIAKRLKNANIVVMDIGYLNDCIDAVEKSWCTVRMCKEWANNWSIILDNDLTIIDGKTIYKTLEDNEHPRSRNAVVVELNDTRYLYLKDTRAMEQATMVEKFRLANPGVEIMDYNVFKKIVSTDLVMDREMFDDIYHMLKGADKEAVDMASEMLTNVNIEKSRFFFDVILMSCGVKIKESSTFNKVTFKPVRHYIDQCTYISNNLNYLRDFEYSNHVSRMFKDIAYSYKKEGVSHKLNYSFIREKLYPFVHASVESTVNIPGTIVKTITFDLDPEVYPDQLKAFKNGLRTQPKSRKPMGKDVQNITSEDLSEYSDEQE